MIRVEQIGNATLYLGNCHDVLGTLDGMGVVVTDPPYGTGGWRRNAVGAGSNPAARLIKEAWDDGSLAWIPKCLNAPIVSFWSTAFMPEMMAACRLHGYTKIRMLYMRKMDPKPQVAGRISWSVEPIVCASTAGFQLYGGTDWIESSTPRFGRDIDATKHPYEKPTKVMVWLVQKIRVGVITDPFMGSGTTGVACARLGRRFVGIENDPDFFDVACRRIKEAQRQADMFVLPADTLRPEAECLPLPDLFGSAA